MSNYNSNLQTNNTNLQSILDTINALPEAGTDLPELTNQGTASDLLSGKELIDQNGNIVTGTIETKTASNLTASGATVTVPAGYYASQATKSVTTTTQATPTITVSSVGKITATSNQTEGYVSTGTKTATKQLTTQAAKTITPTKSAQTAVAKDVYTTGVVTVGAIPNEYVNTTDATATADKIFKNESAYVNGTKVTGTFTIDSEVNTQEDLLTELQTALNGKIGGSGSGNIETCIVSVEGGSHAFYTGIENNVIIAKRFPANSLESSSSFSIPDCICNSSICVYDNSSATTQTITSISAELLYRSELSQIFKITASAGQTATIKISSSSHSGGAIA
jgi:ribosomal protein L31